MMCIDTIVVLAFGIICYYLYLEDRKEEKDRKARRIHDVWENIINGDDDPYGINAINDRYAEMLKEREEYKE